MNQLDRIEEKLNKLLELLEPISKILVRSKTATQAMDLSKDALTRNSKVTKYEQVGHRRTYVEIGELQVIKKRGKKK
jgi:hypothetical protein